MSNNVREESSKSLARSKLIVHPQVSNPYYGNSTHVCGCARPCADKRGVWRDVLMRRGCVLHPAAGRPSTHFLIRSSALSTWQTLWKLFCEAHPKTPQWCWHCRFQKCLEREYQSHFWKTSLLRWKTLNIPSLLNAHVLFHIWETVSGTD